MTQDMARLGAAVAARRAELRLSQEEVAKRGGPSTTTLSKIELGMTDNVSRQTLEKLDRGLDREPGWAQRVLSGIDPSDEAADRANALSGLVNAVKSVEGDNPTQEATRRTVSTLLQSLKLLRADEDELPLGRVWDDILMDPGNVSSHDRLRVLSAVLGRSPAEVHEASEEEAGDVLIRIQAEYLAVTKEIRDAGRRDQTDIDRVIEQLDSAIARGDRLRIRYAATTPVEDHPVEVYGTPPPEFDPEQMAAQFGDVEAEQEGSQEQP